MDPSENLRLQRLLVEQLEVDESDAIRTSHYEALAELVDALDEWLSRGGALPEQWRRP